MVYENLLGYAKVKILRAFGERELQLSEISRISGLSISNVHFAMKDLEKFRIVSFRKVGKTKLYKINLANYYARSIKEFLKTEGKFYDIVLKEFAGKIKKLPGVVSIALFGSLARGKEFPQDIDVLVLCKDREKIKNPIRELEGEILKKYDIHVSATIMPVEDFKKLFKKHDRFALNVVGEGKNIYGKKLEEIVNG